MNDYVHEIFYNFLKQTSFTLSLWGIAQRILRNIINLFHFGIRL